jgi:hypothetical protein
MITNDVIELEGEVIVNVDPEYTYLHADDGNDYLIATRPNDGIFHGQRLKAKVRLWQACGWDGEVIDWKHLENQ